MEYYYKAMKIREYKLGKEHLDTALSYDNISNVYYNIGKYEEAIKYKQYVIQICENKLGLDHLGKAKFYLGMGLLYEN